MNRIAATVALIAVAVGVALLITTGRSTNYRVAAIFDTADGVIPGNQVKIGGVAVGSVRQVDLAPGPKARIVMSVSERLAPFHHDATCTILSEGLISENYVQCDPGSPSSGALGREQGLPTVPVLRTTVPASLQQVLDVFSLPVDDRVRVMLDELGIGTSGRGQDLNAVLQRSNPTLTQAQRVLSLLNAQRGQLAVGIGQMGHVLGALADDSGNVRAFVDRTAAVSDVLSRHRAALGDAIRRLPALLDAVRPGLHTLNRAVQQATPLLHNLYVAAPALLTTTREFPAFASSAIPALRDIGAAAYTGQTSVRAAQPVVESLRQASMSAIPFGSDLDQLLLSTRNTGGLEGLLSVFYAFANTNSAYDGVSHTITLLAEVLPQCMEESGAPGCTSDYNSPGQGTIPPNDPGCGPQQAAIWDPPTGCESILALMRTKPSRQARDRRASTGPRATAPSPPGRGEGNPTTSPRSASAPGGASSPTTSTAPAGESQAPPATGPTGPPTTGTTPPVTGAVEQLLRFLLK